MKQVTALTKYPIVAENIGVKVGWDKHILENVSLGLKKNEFVGLIGGSGSGKTTLMTCLNGYRRPSAGKVIINGRPADDKITTRRLIGYVPQDDIVHPTLTVERALYYSCLLRQESLSEEKIEFRVGKVMYHLDLSDHKNKKISSLSGGQRKRVNIGVELLHSPRLFFLDEPTAGLDPGLERQLMRLLAKLAEKDRVVVMTTHLMQHAHLFHILIFVHKGHMVYFGPGSEITDFFQVTDMIDLFEKIIPADPVMLARKFRESALCGHWLLPRLKGGAHV